MTASLVLTCALRLLFVYLLLNVVAFVLWPGVCWLVDAARTWHTNRIAAARERAQHRRASMARHPAGRRL